MDHTCRPSSISRHRSQRCLSLLVGFMATAVILGSPAQVVAQFSSVTSTKNAGNSADLTDNTDPRAAAAQHRLGRELEPAARFRPAMPPSSRPTTTALRQRHDHHPYGRLHGRVQRHRAGRHVVPGESLREPNGMITLVMTERRGPGHVGAITTTVTGGTLVTATAFNFAAVSPASAAAAPIPTSRSPQRRPSPGPGRASRWPSRLRFVWSNSCLSDQDVRAATNARCVSASPAPSRTSPPTTTPGAATRPRAPRGSRPTATS